MKETLIHELPTVWRDRADDIRPYAPAAAQAFEDAAAELEPILREMALEALTLGQAAEESGYSAEYLGRKVRSGDIANAGKPGAPRIRRADLPRKPGHRRNGNGRILQIADEALRGRR